MARHPRPPSPSPPRAPSDSDAGFDPIEEWLVDFDQAMANELAKSFGLGEEAAAPGAPEPTSCEGGKVSEDGSVSESRGSGVKEEVVEEKDGLLGQFGTSCGGEFDVKESETVSGVLGGQLGPDQVPLSGIGDLAAKEDISEGVVDSEMSTIASDAEMNTAVSVKEEVVGGGGKEESSEDEEEGEESSEASSSSEEEGQEQRAKKDEESSEASSSSDEEEEGAKNHGSGVDMEALLEEGELMIGSEEEEEEAPKGRIKSKHEVEVLPPVPKIEVQLESHHKTLPVGTISAIMGERVIVEGSVQHNPLDEGSILWITESRTPLGIVDELFGPVKNPYYLVRYNSAEEVPAGISAGTAVSFVTEFADHILNMKELYSKGYDASGDNDADQADELGFSDDEKEAEYKRSLRLAKRQTDTQHESKKPSGDKKRAQPRGAGFRKDMPPRIRDAPTGHQSQPHFHRSDTSPVVADNRTHPLGPQNLPMSVPTMLPPVPMSSTMPSAVQIANQMGGCFINPSQQFLPQQPNVVWPGRLPPTPHPNMGVEGAALAANIMQNILIGANQYQQQFQNQNFGGFLNQMPMPPPQFMPQSGMPANPMSFGGPPVNPPFVPAPPLPMGQGNFGQPPHMASEQGPPPGFPNGQQFGRLPTLPGDGEQPPAQFNSGPRRTKLPCGRHQPVAAPAARHPAPLVTASHCPVCSPPTSPMPPYFAGPQPPSSSNPSAAPTLLAHPTPPPLARRRLSSTPPHPAPWSSPFVAQAIEAPPLPGHRRRTAMGLRRRLTLAPPAPPALPR